MRASTLYSLITRNGSTHRLTGAGVLFRNQGARTAIIGEALEIAAGTSVELPAVPGITSRAEDIRISFRGGSTGSLLIIETIVS